MIRVLPEGLRNRIAAGEVVERPASALKELIENSIDARSSKIDVEVLQGGRGLIRVSDDGDGMGREDALLSLKRHATSKLLTEEDLFDIHTMGFRGEALPAIASVSKLTLTTAPRGSVEGVAIKAEGGEITETKDAPSRGTVVEVRDLFFNTPARKKFLKKDSTELAHIVDAVTWLSLSHPEVGFTLKSDGKALMELPRAGGLKERLMQVYGAEFMEGLVPLTHKSGSLSMEAFVSSAGNLRAVRSNQFVFVNRRPVREPLINHAVYSAYGSPSGSHPMFFIFLEADPRRVDFNVHPAKREIRFEDKDVIYRFVRRGVSDALAIKGFAPAVPVEFPSGISAPANPFSSPYSPATSAPGFVSESLPVPLRPEAPFIYLGDTFVAVSEFSGGLTLIDHHAAHERVLYERLLKGVELKSMRLLFPRQVKLSRREYMAVLESLDLLFGFGMEVEDFGHETVLVRSLPEVFMEADLRGVLSDMAGEITGGGRPGKTVREAVAARMACHGSIRGKRILNSDTLFALLRDLDSTDLPGECPHGRPTRISYSLDELKRMFKRK